MREKAIALFLTAILTVLLFVPLMAQTYTLGSYSEPFCVAGDCTNFRVVYGSAAAAEDLAGGSDLIIRLGGDSYTLVSTTGTSATSATGGDSARLDTASNRVIAGEALNNAKQTVTDTDMPTMLADGTLYGDDGTAYAYTQDIQVNGNANLLYSRSDNDLTDPALHIEMGSASGSPTYTTRVTFSKAVPVDSSDIIDNTINLYGGEYTIGTGSDNTTLILYGGANTATISEGEEVTVTVGGTEYTVGIGGVSDEDTAVVTVDGTSESMDQGSSKKISGLDVYLSAVYYYPKEGQVSQAKVTLGSQKITLENGDEVLLGTNTYVDETVVTITGSYSGAYSTISAITIAVPAQDSDYDHIGLGESFEDPVFGSFKLEFSGTTPALDASTNDVITVTGSSDTATVKFTDYGGNEKTIQFGYDNDTSSSSISGPWLMDGNSYKYVIEEGRRVYYKDYLIVDKADDTHLLQLTNIPSGKIKTTDILRFTDVFTGTTYEHTFASSELTNYGGGVGNVSGNVTMRIGSQDYYVSVYNHSSAKASSYVRVTWDDTNSLTGDAGAYWGNRSTNPTWLNIHGDYGNMTIFPQIKANNGEYIIFVNNYTCVPNGTTVIVPKSGTTKGSFTAHNITGGSFSAQGAINYSFGIPGDSAQIPVANNPDCDVRVVPEALQNYTIGIMILEEERADNSYYPIYIGITKTGTTSQTVKVDTPKFIDSSGVTGDTSATRLSTDSSPSFTTWGSDTYTSEAIDGWGAIVKYYNKDEAEATITYPDAQVYGDIFFLAEGASTSTSASGGGTVKSAVPITWSVSLVDTEIQDPSTVDYNLILVGGSCANARVQDLVDAGKLDATFTCAGGAPGAGWETGKGYIWLIEDAFKTGQTVIVVAGTGKAQTKTACSVLQKYDTLLKDSTATAIEITSATTAGITPL
jgi:hypothetical protein